MDPVQISGLMKARHSVRRYRSVPIEREKLGTLQRAVEDVNREGGLHIQLFTNNVCVFGSYYENCHSGFALIGPAGADEKIGYYGEALVLKAQELGLNTCWAGMYYDSRALKVDIARGEKLYLAIALGYGKTQGSPHAAKPARAISNVSSDSPQWFIDGIEAVLLAPSGMNRQSYHFSLESCSTGCNDNCRAACVKATPGPGSFSLVDLGIAKYHFELGAGRQDFIWA